MAIEAITSRVNGHVKIWTGFSNWITLSLFLSTVGFFSVFSATHFMTVLPDGTFNTPLTKGEEFQFNGHKERKWWNQVHMWSVIPIGTLLPLQFLPIVRRTFPAFHRYVGRIMFTMLVCGIITGFRMAFYAFGGTFHTRLYSYITSSLTLYGIYRSVLAGRKKQFSRHRAWAMRTWAYACSILTLRIVLIATVIYDSYNQIIFTHFPLSCEEINYLNTWKQNTTDSKRQALEAVYSRYPSCLTSTSSAGEVFVDVPTRQKYTEQEVALWNVIFGASGLIGLAFNVVAIEAYLWWTRPNRGTLNANSSKHDSMERKLK